MKKRTLVTAALPYANGYLHLGHIAGAYLPADLYVRFKKLLNEDIVFVCGSDEYGTAIEMSALKENTTPQVIIDRHHFANKEAFEKLGIEFDIYSRTSNEMHYKTAQEFFLTLYNNGHLIEKTEKQLYDEKAGKFLADRFVEGTCPICKSEGARGDQCESCGSNLSPLELINPKSKISGEAPVVKETKNYFLPLEKFQPELEKWIAGKTDWKSNVKNYCEGWFKTGLKDRAITRDLEWGIKVPLPDTDGKVIYVWFEAPIGYISATKELFEERGTPEKWKDYWCSEESKLIHFIGKDNIIFHAIVFPSMLMAHGDFILPDYVPANEFLNFEGSKLSKSKGHGILVKDIVTQFNPDLVRYTLASNLPENKDADFSYEEFYAKNNNELAAILGNFINRTVVFAKTKFENAIPEMIEGFDFEILNAFLDQKAKIESCYENFRFRDAVTETMNFVRLANKYFNDSEPWKAIKEDKAKCGNIINNCLQICYWTAVAVSPILPFTSEKILKVLNIKDSTLNWDSICTPSISGGELGENEILFPQLEMPKIEEPAVVEEELNLISKDDFKKVQLRVAKVIECEAVPKSKKLLKVKIKVGDSEKQIVAGISEFYKPEEMIGKKVIVVKL